MFQKCVAGDGSLCGKLKQDTERGRESGSKPLFLNVHPGVYECMFFIILHLHTNVIDILNIDERPRITYMETSKSS